MPVTLAVSNQQRSPAHSAHCKAAHDSRQYCGPSARLLQVAAVTHTLGDRSQLDDFNVPEALCGLQGTGARCAHDVIGSSVQAGCGRRLIHNGRELGLSCSASVHTAGILILKTVCCPDDCPLQSAWTTMPDIMPCQCRAARSSGLWFWRRNTSSRRGCGCGVDNQTIPKRPRQPRQQVSSI
jgi:hypothetical protein